MARARLWLWFGVLVAGDPEQAHTAIDRAVDLYRTLGDPMGLALALLRKARELATMGRLEGAEIALAESFAPLQASHASKAMGLYWGKEGYLRRCQGNAAAARSCYEKATELYRAAGADYSFVVMLGNLADITWSLGDLQASADAFRENIGLLRRSPDARGIALTFSLCNLASVLVEMGELEEAGEVAREGLPALGKSGLAWNFMDHFALRAALAGRIANAARLSGYADAALAARSAQRLVNEARAFERLKLLLAQGLAADELAELRRQGAELDDEAACRLAAEGFDDAQGPASARE
jgi:tetratricopeptide (TPR) repeat protein